MRTVKSTTTVTKEYDDKGLLVKEVIVEETTEDETPRATSA